MNLTIVTEEGERIAKRTRDILESTFQIGRKKVTVFSNHWPSQANPDENRFQAAKVLYNAAKKVKSHVVIALGDFNTVDSDSPHGINDILLDTSKNFHFRDVNANVSSNWEGTHWYRGKWSFLDKIFISNKSFDHVTPYWNSYRVNVAPFLLKEYDWNSGDDDGKDTHLVPYRYNPKTGKGFSDHLGAGIILSI